MISFPILQGSHCGLNPDRFGALRSQRYHPPRQKDRGWQRSGFSTALSN
jgi:hypothetical protein